MFVRQLIHESPNLASEIRLNGANYSARNNELSECRVAENLRPTVVVKAVALRHAGAKGEGNTAPTHFFTSALDVESGQRHA
jgi:hypothetical protein